MVAALECDYDRLEELQSEREDYRSDEFDNQPENQAKAWMEAFPELSDELESLQTSAGECTSREDAEQRIQEDALSVEVRSEWHSPGDANGIENGEFQILLSTGGPAARIMGELRDGEPHRAWLEVQDWGTSWTQYREEGLD